MGICLCDQEFFLHPPSPARKRACALSTLQQECLLVYGCIHVCSRRQVDMISCLIRMEIGAGTKSPGVQVWGAMLFVEQCEQWAREGGAVGHVMGSMLKLVLDDHRHIHPRTACPQKGP